MEESVITILNVDDEDINLYAKSRLLSHAGYTILEATTGAQALQLVQQRPDLIVLDVNLPDMSGIELCQQLKQGPDTAVIPILLISATYVDSEWYVTGLESGADGYLVEPVEPPVFLATVRGMLRAQQAEAALRQARDELELRVSERTAALAEANRALQREILERQRAEADARRLAAHAEALARVAASFNARLEMQPLLELVCKETARLLDVPAAAVALYNESDQTYSFAAVHGLPPYFLEEVQPVPYSTYEQYRQRYGGVRIIPDVQQLSELTNAAIYARADIRTIASVDMDYEGKEIGTLVVMMLGEKRAFDEQELELIKGIADQAALALENVRLFRRVRAGQERLRLLAQRFVTVQEEERQRLSRELHDSASQTLTALQLTLSLVSQAASASDVEVRQGIDEALELAQTLYAEIRAVSHALRPPALDRIDLDQALATLCLDFGRQSGLNIKYHGDQLPPLADMVTVSYYRFLQEGLTNVAKHSGADQVTVHLTCDGDYLRLVIDDNGVGLPPAVASAAPEQSQGVGLPGMRERFELLGGELQIESEPGRGTRLIGSCPVEVAREITTLDK